MILTFFYFLNKFSPVIRHRSSSNGRLEVRVKKEAFFFPLYQSINQTNKPTDPKIDVTHRTVEIAICLFVCLFCYMLLFIDWFVNYQKLCGYSYFLYCWLLKKIVPNTPKSNRSIKIKHWSPNQKYPK